jgi:putative ABC transport system substrate-binding protein
VTQIKASSFLAILLVMCVLPLAAAAQQAGKVYRVGVLFPHSAPPTQPSKCRVFFDDALTVLGYTQGQNVLVEWRYAYGQPERLKQLGEQLVKQGVDVLVVSNATTAGRVKEVAARVPIVVIAGGDLVAAGLAASLARPGGNVTGLHIVQSELAAKRLELVKQVVPSLSRLGVLAPREQTRTAGDGIIDSALRQLEEAGRRLQVELFVKEVREPSEFAAAFAKLATDRVNAVTVLGSPFFLEHRAAIADLALKARLPTIFEVSEHAMTGGLMSYGPNLVNLCGQVVGVVDKILKGARPGDVPIDQPTKFELVINLKTARALGVTIPPSLLLRADQTID